MMIDPLFHHVQDTSVDGYRHTLEAISVKKSFEDGEKVSAAIAVLFALGENYIAENLCYAAMNIASAKGAYKAEVARLKSAGYDIHTENEEEAAAFPQEALTTARALFERMKSVQAKSYTLCDEIARVAGKAAL